MQEDLALKLWAEFKGFITKLDSRDVDTASQKYAYQFVKDTKVIWQCIVGGRLKWACAELTEGRFSNHRYYGALKEALDVEK